MCCYSLPPAILPCIGSNFGRIFLKVHIATCETVTENRDRGTSKFWGLGNRRDPGKEIEKGGGRGMEVEGKKVKTERKREWTKNIPSQASPNDHNTKGKASLSLPPTPRRARILEIYSCQIFILNPLHIRLSFHVFPISPSPKPLTSIPLRIHDSYDLLSTTNPPILIETATIATSRLIFPWRERHRTIKRRTREREAVSGPTGRARCKGTKHGTGNRLKGFLSKPRRVWTPHCNPRRTRVSSSLDPAAIRRYWAKQRNNT